MALEIASNFSAGIIVLSVARPPEPPVAVELEAVLQCAMEHYEERFKCMKELAKSMCVNIWPAYSP